MHLPPPPRSLSGYAFMLAISAALFALARRGDSATAKADACVLQGFFSDWSETYPGTGIRRSSGAMFSSAAGRNQITLVGSDDGEHFWNLNGEYIDQAAGTLRWAAQF
jgi:hypothetical protein